MKHKNSDPELRAAFRDWSAAVVDQLEELIVQLEQPESPLGLAFNLDRVEVRNTLERAWLDLNRLPSQSGRPIRSDRLRAMAEGLKHFRVTAKAKRSK